MQKEIVNKIIDFEILKFFQKTYIHLSAKRKKQLIFLFFFMCFVGFGEMFSLASLIPLLSLLTNPETIWNITILKSISTSFGIISPKELFIPFVIIFTFANIFSNLLRLLSIWLFEKLAAAIGSELSIKGFSSTLNREYRELLEIDSSKLITANTLHLSQYVSCLSLSFKILTSCISSIFIIITVFLISPLISIITITLFLIIYFLIAKTVRVQLYKNSKITSTNEIKQIQIIQESLGSIIEIILSQTQKFHIDKFKKIDFKIRSKYCENRFLKAFPKNILESITFFLLATISLVFSILSKDPEELIKLVGIFALSAQKILPLFQIIYSGLASIQSQSQSIKNFLDLLKGSKTIPSKKIEYSRFNFKNINLKDITFKYANNSRLILNNINIFIKRGDKVGVIGKTGCGKSTLINILIGLIKPDKGYLLIDNLDLNDSNYENQLNFWRRSISYVPQKLFLINNKISKNISFSRTINDSNLQKIYKVAETACADEFINSLPNKYDTFVGEDGSFLSQGQKQRIAIARALFKEPSVIIFDEATSSLDEFTEKKVISSIHNSYKNLTLIMIAHRIKTLLMCDYVIELENGSVKQIIYPDKYDELLLKRS